MLIALIFIVTMLVVVFHLVNKATIASIDKMSEPEGLLEEVKAIDDAHFLTAYERCNIWALKNGFSHQLFFLSYTLLNGEALKCSAWWSATNNTWFLIYVFNDVINYDFFNQVQDKNLTTSSTKTAMMLPAPYGVYKQSFVNISLEQLYAKHRDALAQLCAHFHLRVSSKKVSLIEEMTLYLAAETAFLKSLTLWKYRGFFWFFFRRNLMVNKPIKLKVVN